MHTGNREFGAAPKGGDPGLDAAREQLEKWQQVIDQCLDLLRTGELTNLVPLYQLLQSPDDQQLLFLLLGAENPTTQSTDKNQMARLVRPVSEYLTGQFVHVLPPESQAFAAIPFAVALQEFRETGSTANQEKVIEVRIPTIESIPESTPELIPASTSQFGDLPMAPRRWSRKRRRRQSRRHSTSATPFSS